MNSLELDFKVTQCEIESLIWMLLMRYKPSEYEGH